MLLVESVGYLEEEKGICEDVKDFVNLKGDPLLFLGHCGRLILSLSLPLALFLGLEAKMDKLDLSTSSKGVVKPGE